LTGPAEQAAAAFASVASLTTEPMLLVSPAGDVIAGNPSFESSSGVPLGEALGANLGHLASGDLAGLLERLSQDESGQANETVLAFRGTDGASERLLHVQGARFPTGPDGPPLFALRLTAETDPAARLVDAEAARQRAEAGARARDQFVAALSHELRTPLNAVLGWVRLLRQGTVDESQQTRALEIIERNALAQLVLIEDLLDLSRITSGQVRLRRELVSIGQAARAAMDAVRPALQKKRLNVSSSLDDSATTLGDPERIQQIVANLLSNAVKFTPSGGVIDLQVAVQSDWTKIRVSDTGQGVRPDLLPELFAPGEPASRLPGDLGLSLSIVKQLVDLHGGTIEAESGGAGQGTTYTVKLRTHRGSPSEPAARPGPRAARLQGLRVLVVEDDSDARELFTTLLTQRGAVVTEAASAGEALRLIENRSLDLMLADIGMPDVDGYELIRAVRERSDIPAVAVTAFASVADRENATRAGYSAHLPKPVDLDRLVDMVAVLAKPGKR
jgi:signal transduction histidine kinase